MKHDPQQRIFRREMNRRDFLWLVSAAGAATALAGCATDPVTGESSLVGLTEQQEIEIDRKQSPHQFSADYGAVQDDALNRYVNEVERGLGGRSHRPQMPYSARVLNANYVNAYTFPGGSIGATRGILLELQSEDELAALLGHETGHVNARHAAEQAGRQMAVGLALMAGEVALATSNRGELAPLVGLAGAIGGSALLAKYSRDDEREADALGMTYMTRATYNPDGMVKLMDVLRSQGRAHPGLIETMFSSHPMSDERYATARRAAEKDYSTYRGKPLARERYMDQTAALRALEPAVEAEQKGEELVRAKKLGEAESQFARALQIAPRDYTGLLLMAKLKVAQKRYSESEQYIDRAIAVNPNEAQARQLAGIIKLANKDPQQALQNFDAYDRLLPGNPNTQFFKGVAYESMQNRRAAGEHYYRYLQSGARNDQAQYAARRLREWGMVR